MFPQLKSFVKMLIENYSKQWCGCIIVYICYCQQYNIHPHVIWGNEVITFNSPSLKRITLKIDYLCVVSTIMFSVSISFWKCFSIYLILIFNVLFVQCKCSLSLASKWLLTVPTHVPVNIFIMFILWTLLAEAISTSTWLFACLSLSLFLFHLSLSRTLLSRYLSQFVTLSSFCGRLSGLLSQQLAYMPVAGGKCIWHVLSICPSMFVRPSERNRPTLPQTVLRVMNRCTPEFLCFHSVLAVFQRETNFRCTN